MWPYIVVPLALFNLYLKARPRFFQKEFGVDSWYYLLYAEELRKGRGFPLRMPYFLLDIEEQWYPPLFPALLSLIPPPLLKRFYWLVSPLIDTAQMVLLYFLSYGVTRSSAVAVSASLIYAVSPVLATHNSNLNSRAWGSFILTLAMLCLFFYMRHGAATALFCTVLMGAALLNSHKMASQQMVFLLLVFLLLYRSIALFFLLPLIFAAAFLLSGGFYYKVLKAHIAILKYCRRHSALFFRHQVYLSPLYYDAGKALKNKGCGGIMSDRLWRFLAVAQFGLILLAVGGYAAAGILDLGAFEQFCLAWFAANLICVSAITYIPALKFLGEGTRYFMYGVFPSSFLLSRLIFYHSVAPPGVIIFCLIILSGLAVILRVHSEQKKNILATVDAGMRDVLEYLRASARDNVMCFPNSYCDAVAYFCRKRVLKGDHSCGYDKLAHFAPVLLRPVDYFIDAYKISFCLVNNNYVRLEDLKITAPYNIVLLRGQLFLLEFAQV